MAAGLPATPPQAVQASRATLLTQTGTSASRALATLEAEVAIQHRQTIATTSSKFTRTAVDLVVVAWGALGRLHPWHFWRASAIRLDGHLTLKTAAAPAAAWAEAPRIKQTLKTEVLIAACSLHTLLAAHCAPTACTSIAALRITSARMASGWPLLVRWCIRATSCASPVAITSHETGDKCTAS